MDGTVKDWAKAGKPIADESTKMAPKHIYSQTNAGIYCNIRLCEEWIAADRGCENHAGIWSGINTRIDQYSLRERYKQ